MKRGILYIVWPGEKPTEQMLERSIASVRKWHPELPVEVKRLPDSALLLDKARMARLTPFESTLYLDADTVVLSRLDFGFDQAERFGLACCICECPWARRYGGFKDRGDMVEYNTGVLFFTPIVKRLFEAWEGYPSLDSSILFDGPDGLVKMLCNDQAGFAEAVRVTGFNPAVLPLNWNFRPLWQLSWFGEIKVWHDYSEVPAALADWNANQSASDSIIRYAVSRA